MRKALILGASSDIGQEVVNIFLKNNYQVYAHYNKSLIKKKSKEYKNLINIKSNFSNISSFNSFKNKIKKIKFDTFINLIGYLDNKKIDSLTIHDFQKSIAINAVYPMMISNIVSKSMIQNSYGRILQCSSIGVKFGGGQNTVTYSLSKHLLEFIPSYYRNLFKKNILYNVLRIGVTNTKIHKKISGKNLKKRISFIPMKRMASIYEIASYIYFLSSNENTYINLQVLSISGGE